jgi:transaldolase
MDKEHREAIRDFILSQPEEKPFTAQTDPFWQGLRAAGTELWLDTGDMEEAASVWSAEMTALTTNNTLLNAVIQKGVYDDFIPKAREMVRTLSPGEQVREIAFMLNARHGNRLVQRFGGMVSVELHTDTAHDVESIVKYGLRYADINPHRFIVKVPYTAEGLLGARRLHEHGVRINLTLGFSARQNLLATAIAQPDYVNVFLGRLGAYCSENGLGSGKGIGERAVSGSGTWVKRMAAQYGLSTRLIAASLRGAAQLESLAGTPVFTMPVKVASEGRNTLKGTFTPMAAELPAIDSYPAGLHLEKLWEVSERELLLVRDLADELPCCGDALQKMVDRDGCGDMFPHLSPEDLQLIAADGKIPRHERWADRISSGKLAVDTLLNLAGLASFSADQARLDERIARIIA